MVFAILLLFRFGVKRALFLVLRGKVGNLSVVQESVNFVGSELYPGMNYS